jgi:hypothetical protein
MRKWSKFVIAAALSFAALAPVIASSAIRTIGGFGCITRNDPTVNRNVYNCDVPAGSDFQVQYLTGAYFDFNAGTVAEQLLEFGLLKFSFTGSGFNDIGYYSSPGDGKFHEIFVKAVNVKAGASQWDYLEASAMVDDLLGVGVVTTN